VIGYVREHVPQIAFWIEPIQFSRSDQAIKDSSTLAPGIGTSEQIILTTQGTSLYKSKSIGRITAGLKANFSVRLSNRSFCLMERRQTITNHISEATKFHSVASKEKNVIEADRSKYLRIALVLVGVTFIVGIYTLIIIWPSGWSWHSGPSHHLPHYLQMILGVYATLGIFLVIASRDPLANLSLIWFTVWSSVVHAGIMALQALANPEQMGHLWGDVPALLLVAAVLALLTPRRAESS
jgi:hypothetical protein